MDNNPYDFPVHSGSCTRCKAQNTFVIGSMCINCMTGPEKKVYGIDQELIEEDYEA